MKSLCGRTLNGVKRGMGQIVTNGFKQIEMSVNTKTNTQPFKDTPHMQELLGGVSDIPLGQICFPLKRVCKIKHMENTRCDG